MADELKIPVSAPGAQQAAQDLARVAEAERKVGQDARDAGRSAGEGAAGMERLASAGKQVLAGLGIGTGISAGVAAIVGLVRQWQQHMEEIARLSRQAGQEMVAFALMQEPGKAGERAREAAGAIKGEEASPGVSFAAVAELQGAAGGDYAKGLEAAREVEKLRLLGVPVEQATQAVSLGMGMGMTGPEAARALFAAGGPQAPAFAQAAIPSLPAYRGVGGGPRFGYDVMAALEATYKEPGQLGTMTRQVALALREREGDIGKTWRRLGIAEPGADPMAQLQALAAKGITTPEALRRAGFGGRGEEALSALLSDLPGFEARRAETAARYARPGLLGEARAAAETPQMIHARRIEELETGIAVEKLFGAEAEPARRRELYEAAAAAEMERLGFGFLVGGDKRAGGWAVGLADFLAGLSPTVQAERRSAGTPWWRGRIQQAAEERLAGIGEPLGMGFFGNIYIRNGGTDYEKGLEDVAGEPVRSGME